MPRCPIARDRCAAEHPALVPDSTGRPARCFYTDDATAVRPAPPAGVAVPAEGAPLLASAGVERSFGPTRVLRGIDLAVRRGETVGLVGESGSGKSTFARVVAGLVPPSAGTVALDGRPLALTAARRPRAVLSAIQMVFQSPDTTLNRAPPGLPHRWPGGGTARRAGTARGTAEGARPAGGGAAARLGVRRAPAPALGRAAPARRHRARLFAGEPELVILDEPTSALDVSVQAAVLDLLLDLQRDRGVAYLFISHDLAVVRYLADRIAVLYRGELVEVGPAAAVFDAPRHPYTRSLLAAMPEAGRARRSRPGSRRRAGARRRRVTRCGAGGTCRQRRSSGRPSQPGRCRRRPACPCRRRSSCGR